MAERVIRSASVPVLAVRAGTEASAPPASALLDRVLVPLDGSELAWRAVEALGTLKGERALKIVLAGVAETLGGPGEEPSAEERGRDLIARFIGLQCDDLRERLARAAERATALGFGAEVEILVGRPAARILDCAARVGATMIAMATHGRSGISRWTLGSVTEQVLHASSVPVLVCRPVIA